MWKTKLSEDTWEDQGIQKSSKNIKGQQIAQRTGNIENGLTDEFLVISTEKSLNHWYQHQTRPTACLPFLHSSLLGRLQWRKC